MPRLSVVLIRSALLYLGVGFTLGMLLLFNKGIPLQPWLWRLLPLHIEFLLYGWTLQLAMGVAFWILPRWNSSRGNERLVWLAFASLNAGILSVSVGSGYAMATLIVAGRFVETIAALLFVLHAYPRVKSLGVQ